MNATEVAAGIVSEIKAAMTAGDLPRAQRAVDGIVAQTDEVRAEVARLAGAPVAPPTKIDRWLAGERVDVRAEVALLQDAHRRLRESIQLFVTQLQEESVRVGEDVVTDQWGWGYRCGKSRQAAAVAVALCAIQNSAANRGPT